MKANFTPLLTTIMVACATVLYEQAAPAAPAVLDYGGLTKAAEQPSQIHPALGTTGRWEVTTEIFQPGPPASRVSAKLCSSLRTG